MSEHPTRKILVVDDDSGVTTLICRHFESLGYAARSAGNGQEALAAVKEDVPSLIILDRMMPVMDGIKTCVMLKADKRYSAIPVIMITASTAAIEARMSEEAGASAFFNKPLDMTALELKVRALAGAP